VVCSAALAGLPQPKSIGSATRGAEPPNEAAERRVLRLGVPASSLGKHEGERSTRPQPCAEDGRNSRTPSPTPQTCEQGANHVVASQWFALCSQVCTRQGLHPPRFAPTKVCTHQGLHPGRGLHPDHQDCAARFAGPWFAVLFGKGQARSAAAAMLSDGLRLRLVVVPFGRRRSAHHVRPRARSHDGDLAEPDAGGGGHRPPRRPSGRGAWRPSMPAASA
jgi:hypothetical protein